MPPPITDIHLPPKPLYNPKGIYYSIGKLKENCISNKLIKDNIQSSCHLNVTNNSMFYKRRNIILKLIAGNEKLSYKKTLRKMQWNNLHDIQNYMFQQNSERTTKRQRIKYIGNFWTDVNITLKKWIWVII